jgi:virginiamycin B lyase
LEHDTSLFGATSTSVECIMNRIMLLSLIAVTAVLVFIFALYEIPPFKDTTRNQKTDLDNYYQRGSIDETSEGKKITSKDRKYTCGTSIEKRNEFITEYTIPAPCTQPVGIAIDSHNKVWIGATWIGYLVVFDPKSNTFTEFIKIPNWSTKGTFGSFIWGMEFDKLGNLWFTDQVNNAIWKYENSTKKFEMYMIPTRSSYPVQVGINPAGEVWFSEIFGKKLGVIEPNEARNGTSDGITEYELKQIDFETMGPMTIGKNGTIWLTAVSFPEGGNIVKFDPITKNFTVFDLPKGTGVPIL